MGMSLCLSVCVSLLMCPPLSCLTLYLNPYPLPLTLLTPPHIKVQKNTEMQKGGRKGKGAGQGKKQKAKQKKRNTHKDTHTDKEKEETGSET